MSFPGAIQRPLLPDEFSIYFASEDPIPLAAMATFLRKLDTFATQYFDEEGVFLELSEYASGSGEPRFRIVGPGRIALREAEQLQLEHERHDEQIKWQKRAFYGAIFIGPFAGAVASAMIAGPLNPSARSLVNQTETTAVIVRAPTECYREIPADEIAAGHDSTRQRSRKVMAVLERENLGKALEGRRVVRLAGRPQIKSGTLIFRTVLGNALRVIGDRGQRVRSETGRMIVIEALVVQEGSGLALEMQSIITGIDDI